MGKNLAIRLYKQHDMDLILLYKNKNFSFSKAMKSALRAYAEGTPLFFLPPALDEIGEINTVYRISISLKEPEDNDIIKMLEETKALSKNAAAKSILRGCIIGSFAYGCMSLQKYKEYTETIHEAIKTSAGIPQAFIVEAPKKGKNRTKNSATKKEKTVFHHKKENFEEEKADILNRDKQKEETKPTKDINKEIYERRFEPEIIEEKTQQANEIPIVNDEEDDFDFFGSLASMRT